MKGFFVKTKEYAVKNKSFFILFAAFLPKLLLEESLTLIFRPDLRKLAWLMIFIVSAAGITVLNRCFSTCDKKQTGIICAAVYFVFYFGIGRQTLGTLNWKCVVCVAVIIAGIDIIISDIPSVLAIPCFVGSIFIDSEMSILCLPAAITAALSETALFEKVTEKKRPQNKRKETKAFTQKVTEGLRKVPPVVTAIVVSACYVIRLAIYLSKKRLSPAYSVQMIITARQHISWLCTVPFFIIVLIALIAAFKRDREFCKPFIATVAAAAMINASGALLFGTVFFAEIFALTSVLAGGSALICCIRKKPEIAKILADGAEKYSFAALLAVVICLLLFKDYIK